MGLGVNLLLKPCLLFNNLAPLAFTESDELKKVQILTFADIKDI